MKALAITFAFILNALLTLSQTEKDFISLGNVICRTKDHYLDSTQKAYNIHYIDGLINESKYLIDITLSVSGYPNLASEEARFYWDTTFKLYYVIHHIMDDRGCFTKHDTTYAPRTMSLDSLFSKLIEQGLFNLPLISTENVVNSWNAIYTSKTGAFGENRVRVSDGNEYVLTFKVKDCFGQYIFNNPDAYSRFYIDNTIFRRQDAIVKILMASRP